VVAGINDLEAHCAQHTSRTMHAAAEVVGSERPTGRVPVRYAENSLGIVFLVVEDQQICRGAAEVMVGEELVLPEPVILGCCLPDAVGLYWIPSGHL